MLTLSADQLETLGQVSRERYVDRVCEALTEAFPQQTSRLGEDETRVAVAALINRASVYALQSEHDLFLFCCMAFAFGRDFDTDPELPWAGGSLRSHILGCPSERMAHTYRLALAAAEQSDRPWVPIPQITSESFR